MTNHFTQDEDVFDEDANDDVMAGVDISKFFPAATDDLVCVLLASCVTTRALRLHFCYLFLPLSNPQDGFLHLLNLLRCLRNAVQSPPPLLGEAHINRALICQDLLQKQRGLSL